MPISFIGWFGILLGFSALFALSGRKWSWDKLGFVFLLAAIQTAVGIYFYFYALENDSDAGLYYYDPYNFHETIGFGLNTQFIIWTVQTLKAFAGGSYLDYFLLFQASGTWGAVFIMKAFRDTFDDANIAQPNFLLFALLLPGIHFWTAFIGKDGLLFLGASVAIWAAIDLRKRWVPLGLGIGLMLFCRPHIAMAAVTALMIAVLFDKKTSPAAKIVLGVLATGALIGAAVTLRSTFNLDLSSADSVSDFITRQSRITSVQEGSTNITDASFPVKLFSLMFRPLFVDSGGTLPGLIASFENLLLLALFFYFIIRRKLAFLLIRRVFYIRFAAIYAVLVTLMLALVYYNVGLGLRQKVMVMPALLLVFAAVVAAERVRRPAPRRVLARA